MRIIQIPLLHKVHRKIHELCRIARDKDTFSSARGKQGMRVIVGICEILSHAFQVTMDFFVSVHPPDPRFTSSPPKVDYSGMSRQRNNSSFPVRLRDLLA